jgi:sporulation protein YlmC with PRC-barrel domain
MTAHELLNKRVHASDGACVGRIFDFRGRWDGTQLLITHVNVGVRSWLARLGMQNALKTFRLARELELPWEAIAAIGKHVQLGPGWDRAACEAHTVNAR